MRCGACAAGSFRAFLAAEKRKGRPFQLVRCRSCGLVQAADRPDPEALRAYYAGYSYEQEAAWAVTPATEAALDRLATRLAPYRVSGAALDVGCGAGVVLRAFHRHGWAIEGSELSTLAAERLRKEGLRIHVGDLDSLGLKEGTFDVIIMSEILEHLLEPRRVLEEAHRLLRSRGALYLTTPNVDSLSRHLLGAVWRVIEVPEHLFYFDHHSLRQLLTAVGFTPEKVWSEGVNPFELWSGLRPARNSAAAQTATRTEGLRSLTLRSRTMAGAKVLVNAGLRVSGLGDTLKALATKA